MTQQIKAAAAALSIVLHDHIVDRQRTLVQLPARRGCCSYELAEHSPSPDSWHFLIEVRYGPVCFPLSPTLALWGASDGVMACCAIAFPAHCPSCSRKPATTRKPNSPRLSRLKSSAPNSEMPAGI